MGRFAPSRRTSWLAVASLVALLAVLATLQYRWTGELSRAEGERLHAGLAAAARRFAGDFDRELTRAFLAFQPPSYEGSLPDGALYARLARRWRETAPYPGLVDGIYRVSRQPGGILDLARLDGAAGRFETVGWPPELGELRRRLALPGAIGEGGEAGRAPRWHLHSLVLAPEVPALVIPLVEMPREGGQVRMGSLRSLIRGFVVVRLDLSGLRDDVFPLLVRRYFGDGDDLHEELAIYVTEPSHRLLYRTEVGVGDAASPAPADVTVPMFRFVAPDELESLWPERRGDLAVPAAIRRLLPRLVTLARVEEAGWRLQVGYPGGSIATAVRRLRGRNLAVSFGILVLLGLTVSLLVASSRRAQRLAERQMEFVTGVTHELRTPLAAIGSLGQNLEDGVVRSEDQVRRYGGMIRREQLRLTAMVEQVLELAGILGRRGSWRPEPTDVARVVREAVADHAMLVAERGCRVEVEVPQDLPAVWIDGASLRRAVGNLLSNAVKYGADGGWVRVAAERREAKRGAEVALRVTDAGPGIPAEDLPHLFEPFYRGRWAGEAQIQGSGLGLSLVKRIVESQGGRVEVGSEPGRGSAFTLHLPVAEEPDAERQDPADRG